MLVRRKKPQNAHRRKSRVSHPPDGHIRVAADVQRSRYFRTKEIIERIVAAFLLLPGLPLIGLLTLVVRLHSRGPGIYRQARLGKNAKIFNIYKIRTMRQDAEQKTGPVWATPHDTRITPLGRFLRKVHLDELPQLINVVKNEMSLIGPRPERPEIAAVLAEKIPGYTDRMAVLPGVTGLAQINLPPDSTLDDVRRKLLLDVKYIRQAGPWLDARILMSTFVRLLGLPGSWAMLLFGLRCAEVHDCEGLPAVAASEDDEAAATSNGHGNGRANAAAASGNGHSDEKKSGGMGKPHTDPRKPR
jgi:lipopolysaccharide/colanic/teichoic acid biosynthesis glycosyltransferase